MSDLGRSLRLDSSHWETIRADQLLGKLIMVVIAYLLLAVNRFGVLGFTAPKAAVRLVLVGVYSWLILAGFLWLVGRYASSSSSSDPSGQPRPTLPMAAVAVGTAHAPLLGTAIFIAVVAGFAQLQGPGWIAAIVLVGLWMPALLVQATQAITGLARNQAIALGLGSYLVWLATTGRFLHAQVGHLL